jgi:uncharacterized membrane protein
MHLSSNVSHWVCLIAGLYLVLTGFMVRDIAEDQPPRIVHPAGTAAYRHQRAAGYGRRAVLVAVGLVAVVYGVARLLE